MTAEEVKVEGGGRRVLVGVQIDGNGRELLSWALDNVAREGDRVVAVHVSRASDLGKTTQSSIRALDLFLAEYEDLCTLKRVALAGRVSWGISIRRTLAKEALLCAAAVVVVGANIGFSLGGSASASVAKYCAKKLPPTTALIALHNGKVIFEKGSINPPSGEESKRPNLRSILHPNVGMDTKAKPGAAELPRLSDIDREDGSNDRRLVVYDSSSISVLVRKLPEPRPGWPLLRRAVAANIGALRDSEAREMSVVQWVMNLPDRSLFESATSDLIKELEIILHNN